MPRHLTFPGARFCEALPDGRFAALQWNSHIATDYGAVPLPPGGNALYLRRGPGPRIACCGHTDDRAWEWDGATWTDRGPVRGINAVVYDGDRLIVNGGQAPPTGYRTATVLCDQTLADGARQIFDYTDLSNDLTVGQGGDGPHGDDPMIALFRGVRYRLHDGRNRFVRANLEGSTLALGWVRQDTDEAHLLWCDLSELVSFPDDDPNEREAIPVPGETPSLGVRWVGCYKDAGHTLPGNCYHNEPLNAICRRSDGAVIAQMVPDSDSREWVTPAGTKWTGLYCYVDAPGPRTVAEAQAACRTLCVSQLATLPLDQPVVLICQMYDRNLTWTNEATLAGLMQAYPIVAAEHPNVVALMYFSGPDRRGGTADHPCLIPWYRAACAAVTGEPAIDAPVIVGPPQPPSPPVTGPVAVPRANPPVRKSGSSKWAILAAAAPAIAALLAKLFGGKR